MCGLFCGVGKLSSNRMIALGSMNEERGTDSVGIAYWTENEVRIAKIAERPCVGLNIALRKQVTEAATSGLFIGHTRQATQGTVTSRNAHPFLSDGIAFAHNGIILNDDDFGTYEVDSESLIHGIKAKDFSKYKGPIALVWIEGGKLHAYRYGNPLARGRHNGSMYLASETDYLKEIGCTHVKELSEGMIYTFDSPVAVKAERVPKNRLYGASSKGSSIYTGGGWEDYLDRTYRRNSPALLPSITDAETREDFRTSSDIAKERAKESCECCGKRAELSEGRMCLVCIEWMDDNGVNRDVPHWLKVH